MVHCTDARTRPEKPLSILTNQTNRTVVLCLQILLPQPARRGKPGRFMVLSHLHPTRHRVQVSERPPSSTDFRVLLSSESEIPYPRSFIVIRFTAKRVTTSRRGVACTSVDVFCQRQDYSSDPDQRASYMHTSYKKLSACQCVP